MIDASVSHLTQIVHAFHHFATLLTNGTLLILAGDGGITSDLACFRLFEVYWYIHKRIANESFT